MSKSGITGALGIHSQSAKGTTAPTLNYFPATSVNLNTIQNTQSLPPEVAGSYFPRGAYKAGAAVSGDVSFLIRPEAIGNFFYALCGQDTVTPVVGQTGAYQHVFTPFAPGASADLPWMTLLKDVSKMYTETYTDCKLSDLRVDLTKQAVATASASFFGITGAETAEPSETFESTSPFVGCTAAVALVNEVGQASISSEASKPERVTLAFQNRISEDEYVVGQYGPEDITLLQRSVNISYDIVVRDPALVRSVYRNGGSGAWSPTIFRGHLTLTLNSTQNVGATTQPYQCVIDMPGIDFLMMPVPISGGQLVRANLSAQISLGSSGADTFTITLINGTSAY